MIISKGPSIGKNCLRPESLPLNVAACITFLIHWNVLNCFWYIKLKSRWVSCCLWCYLDKLCTLFEAVLRYVHKLLKNAVIIKCGFLQHVLYILNCSDIILFNILNYNLESGLLVKVLQLELKRLSSNPSKCLAGLRDPTSLQESWLLSGRSSWNTVINIRWVRLSPW